MTGFPRNEIDPTPAVTTERPFILSTPQPPSADQLAAARLLNWRQNGSATAEEPSRAVLTLDAARQFVSRCGLVLFAPRPQLIGSPAPTFVEKTLGVTNAAPSLAEMAEARTLLARLVAEGTAVPLSLLGAPGVTPDTPDFVASIAAFPYVFTLRGDKAFKQLPATSGATKVSPLALNTYNLLLENGPTSASDLASALGKEVTEAAVLRALNELWQHLRVLPVVRADGGDTVWETVLNRFTKQLKAGANAGQPSALSALTSLYLGQALLATEADVETFLSPLAPRSRVRDVLHALTGAREIETVAVDGKTHLHLRGELPTFAAAPAEGEAEGTEESSAEAPAGVELAEDGTRIKKFVPKPRKVGTGYVERAKPFGGAKRPAREGRSFERGATGPRGAAGPRGAGPRPGAPRKTFDRPWDEERAQRPGRDAGAGAPGRVEGVDAEAGSAERSSSGADRGAKRPFGAKPPFGAKRPFGTRPSGDRAGFGGGARPSRMGGDRPAFSRGREADTGERPARPRREGADGGGAPFERRPSFGKGGGFGKGAGDRASAPGDRERRPFRRDGAEGGARPPRREFGEGAPRGERPARSADAPGARPFRPRREGEGEGRAPFRKFDAPRSPRKTFRKDGEEGGPPRREFSGPAKPRTQEGGSDRGPAGAREGSRPYSGASRPREGGGFAPKRAGGGFASRGPGGANPGGPAAGPGSRAGGFAAKRPFAGRPSGPRGADAPGASTFDKFKGGNKPWGKRPPGRKPKPDEGEG